MTFAAFRTLAFGFLDVDANRRGIETLRDRLLRAAIMDLKHYVPQFADGVAKYDENDVVPFADEIVHRCAEAVALFMKARITRPTEKDLALAGSYERDYISLRRWLFREAKGLSLSLAAFDGTPLTGFDGSLITLFP